MTIKRRQIEVFSLSFLDVICCGFGAIILLLVLTMALEPATREQLTSDLKSQIEQIEREREEVIVKSQTLQDKLGEKQATVLMVKQDLKELEAVLSDAENSARTTELIAQAQVKEKLQSVLQSLTKEMKNLLSQDTYQPPGKEAVIGGIPVDSEYIVFVIDTSGSMLASAWPTVIKKVKEVLSVYPNVKGLQVLNDNGNYMFSEYAGRWIPDTPSRRRAVIQRLRGWKSSSNSSPVEGITRVLRTYSRMDANISIYVFGDDFAGGNVDNVLNEVSRINKKDIHGKSRMRIHTFGFPVKFVHPLSIKSRAHFPHLMRLLAEQNSGSFVGLTDAGTKLMILGRDDS